MCAFITRRKTEASLMNRVWPVLAGPMRSKVLVLFSTLSAMVTRARRRLGGSVGLDEVLQPVGALRNIVARAFMGEGGYFPQIRVFSLFLKQAAPQKRIFRLPTSRQVLPRAEDRSSVSFGEIRNI